MLTVKNLLPRRDTEDKELMARVAEGDHGAFREIVKRYQGVIYGLAYRYLGNSSDAEEIAQETFCRLHGAASRYRPDAAFRTYLLRITTNLCTNRRARAYRRLEESRDPVDLEVSHGGSANPESQLLKIEKAEAVRKAVLALPDDQRIALILFRFEGMSYEEIAALTGKSVLAVTSALWRARASLRRSLDFWSDKAPLGPTNSRVKPPHQPSRPAQDSSSSPVSNDSSQES